MLIPGVNVLIKYSLAEAQRSQRKTIICRSLPTNNRVLPPVMNYPFKHPPPLYLCTTTPISPRKRQWSERGQQNYGNLTQKGINDAVNWLIRRIVEWFVLVFEKVPLTN